MNKILFLATFFVVAFAQVSFAQDSTQQKQLAQLLAKYYALKDALVASDASATALMAEAFLKTTNAIDYKVISEGNINALLKDATAISSAKDIKKQRELFANLSSNMAALAKAIKLTNEPIYQAYCPMKKASWLSSDPAIKNPYYGSSMLTCGNVVDTIR